MFTIRNKQDMQQAMKQRQPFMYRSYSARIENDRYILKHWYTDIAASDLNGNLSMIYVDYISQTTSTFTGMILRNVFNENALNTILKLLEDDKTNLHRFKRMIY